ncbi:hypothetical protein HY212_07790 [Candidatus Pacearchaeota archaeon]|nr:hypothetical protein [Candidatus Pacearchaeota archaeon]
MGLIGKIKVGFGLIAGTYLMFSCANTIRPLDKNKSRYNHDLRVRDAFVMYEAGKGESIENLFESEGGDINNARKFINFEEDIYNATGRLNGYGCMTFDPESGKLEIICSCVIWVRDLNRDGKTGKPKPEIQRKKLTYG